MGNLLLVGTRKGLFVYRRGAAGWAFDKVCFLGEPATQCLIDGRDGSWYVTLTLGHFGAKLHRSTDEGRAWTPCGAPSYPAGAEFAAMGPDGAFKTKPASLTEIWCLEAGGPDQPGLLWAGTIPGGLFRSRDHGATWELIESLWNRPERMRWFGGGKDEPGIHSIRVHPQDSRRLLLGVSCGGVWATADGGQTWENRGQGLRQEYTPPELAYDIVTQDVHRLARCAAAPDHVWAQHHNGMFRSTDEGRSFTELQNVRPSNFGFAVAAHPRDPLTAWFAPATKDQCRVPVDGKLVVNLTTDGGAAFTQLAQGLPQVHAYHVVYRHGLEVDASGRHLALGSTTGGLWTSADEGQSWQALNTHLPPVYVVRFAET